MGFTNKFAESFARSKTMTGPERKANEIMGKLLLKKAIVPIILMFIVLIAGIQIAYGGEDFENLKKNQMVQVSYNPDAKIAILVNKQ